MQTDACFPWRARPQDWNIQVPGVARSQEHTVMGCPDPGCLCAAMPIAGGSNPGGCGPWGGRRFAVLWRPLADAPQFSPAPPLPPPPRVGVALRPPAALPAPFWVTHRKLINARMCQRGRLCESKRLTTAKSRREIAHVFN